MERVTNLFIAVEHRKPMKALDEVVAIADRGFEGCIHARSGGKRQVLLVESEMLAEFGLAPGIVRENITTAGLKTADLKQGQRIAVGRAILEVTIPCEPCSRIEEIRPGLQEALQNRRGVLCRIVVGGLISVGDAIEIGSVNMAIPSVGGAS